MLLIFTLLISGSGKHACFRGRYCYLGAPIGVPRVQDGILNVSSLFLIFGCVMIGCALIYVVFRDTDFFFLSFPVGFVLVASCLSSQICIFHFGLAISVDLPSLAPGLFRKLSVHKGTHLLSRGSVRADPSLLTVSLDRLFGFGLRPFV